MESMTGYGMAKKELEDLDLVVEVRSVNHRYGEVHIHMPDSLLYLEGSLRKKIKAYIRRGKVDLYIRYKRKGEGQSLPQLNEEIFKGYLDLVNQGLALGGDFNRASILDFLQLEGILDYDSSSQEEDLKDLILASTEEALAQLKAMRQAEGKNLKEDMEEKLKSLEAEIQILTENRQDLLEDQKKDYLERLEILREDLDPSQDLDDKRIYTELAILADKWTVDEEIVRLNSHLDQFRGIMVNKGPVGRKLDFLLQEFNREANTIASKTKSIPMLNHVVEMKAMIEQLREQVQNIE